MMRTDFNSFPVSIAQKALSSPYRTPLIELTLLRTVEYSFLVLPHQHALRYGRKYDSRLDHLLVGPEVDRLGVVVVLDTVVEADQICPVALSSISL